MYDPYNLDKIKLISIKNNITLPIANVAGNYKGLFYLTGTDTSVKHTRVYLENNVGGILDRSTYSLINPEINYFTYETSKFLSVDIVPFY